MSDISRSAIMRGLERVFPGEEEVFKFLTQTPKRIYMGIDPTAPSLHLGHLSLLLKLRDLQEMGHAIIILIGDFTACIGDPTGKKSARTALSSEQVKFNETSYLTQISHILPPGSFELRHNSEWLDKLSPREFIELTSQFTVGQMIERDMFQERIRANEPIYIHEFLYPLLQGYDSVALSADGEVGGNDQTFNMMAGRSMYKRKGGEKVVLATKLLVDASGKKMGKTEGNMVFLSDDPTLMYGKIMSWPDSLLPLAYEILTREPLDGANLSIKEDPLAAKKKLARIVTTFIHGERAALVAEEGFGKKFSSREISDDIPTISCAPGALLVDVVIDSGLVESRSKWRRLVEERAVEEVQGSVLTNPLIRVERSLVLRIGKARFLKIELSS